MSETREALEAFARAAENLDDATPDRADIWEHPAAMCITAGDLRKAARAFSALSARDERAEERERCARVAECFREDEGPVAFRIAAAIRAGGNDGPR